MWLTSPKNWKLNDRNHKDDELITLQHIHIIWNASSWKNTNLVGSTRDEPRRKSVIKQSEPSSKWLWFVCIQFGSLKALCKIKLYGMLQIFMTAYSRISITLRLQATKQALRVKNVTIFLRETWGHKDSSFSNQQDYYIRGQVQQAPAPLARLIEPITSKNSIMPKVKYNQVALLMKYGVKHYK